MLRRLPTILFALLFAGAPVATELCNAACAADEEGHAAGAPFAHHSCHSAPPAPGGPAVSGVQHTCGHADGVQDGISAALQRLAAPAIAEPGITFERPLISTRLEIRPSAESPPP